MTNKAKYSKPRSLYWDSCVFLSHLNAIPDRQPTIDEVVEEIRDQKDSIIYTSSETIVEVAYVADEREGFVLHLDTEERIDAMLADASLIRIVDNGPHIAWLARDLIREAIPNEWILKPKDAIHLASAYWLSKNGIKIDEVNTYDKKLGKFQAMIGMHIVEPHVVQHRMKVDNDTEE